MIPHDPNAAPEPDDAEFVARCERQIAIDDYLNWNGPLPPGYREGGFELSYVEYGDCGRDFKEALLRLKKSNAELSCLRKSFDAMRETYEKRLVDLTGGRMSDFFGLLLAFVFGVVFCGLMAKSVIERVYQVDAVKHQCAQFAATPEGQVVFK